MSDKRILASDNPEDVYKKDYHGHPNYRNIYLLLLFFLVVTLIPNIVQLVIGHKIDIVWWTVILIFLFSTWKAILVIRNFMHLKFEPGLVFGVVGTGLLCLIILFWLVKADVSSMDPNTKMLVHSTEEDNKIIYDDNIQWIKNLDNNIKSLKTKKKDQITKKVIDIKSFSNKIHPQH